MRLRNTKQGLRVSELGSYMDGYRGLSKTATAGTKRLSNLLRSLTWSMLQIDRYVLKEADTEVKRLKEQGKRILCMWDGSVIEKPESHKIEGLCPLVSSKAKRLNRSSKGLVFNLPPRKPVTVAAMGGMIHVALMSWWSTKGADATNLRAQEEALLRTCVRQWGDILLHIFDRGYASGPWIQVLSERSREENAVVPANQ
jgi:hypothetical protein